MSCKASYTVLYFLLAFFLYIVVYIVVLAIKYLQVLSPRFLPLPNSIYYCKVFRNTFSSVSSFTQQYILVQSIYKYILLSFFLYLILIIIAKYLQILSPRFLPLPISIYYCKVFTNTFSSVSSFTQKYILLQSIYKYFLLGFFLYLEVYISAKYLQILSPRFLPPLT